MTLILPGFDDLKAELGPSRDSSMVRGMSLDVSYDEQDIMKVGGGVDGNMEFYMQSVKVDCIKKLIIKSLKLCSEMTCGQNCTVCIWVLFG